MRDVLDDLTRWWRAGEPVGMATVVATWRSAPRPPGATMLVGPDGTAVGSVSGGCVEGAVDDLAKEVKDVEWLVATGQLTEVRVCRKRRFDSKDVDELIEMYKRVQARRRDDEKA